MTLRSIIAIAASCSLLLSCSQSTPETIVVPLEKANESLTRGLAYWMNGNMEVTRDSDYPERVTSVKTTLHGTIPVEAIFNEDNTITYKFPDRYETINVPVDSMRVYRKRARFELDGPTTNWKIGEYPTGDSNYEVWVKPDGNVSFNDNDFFNDFAIYAQIGNVYKGSVNAPDGDVYLTIEHSMDNQTPTIIFPVGKYEDFSSFRPEINGGLITNRVRTAGEMIQTGKNTFYRIDSINPTYTELILKLVKDGPELIKANDQAMNELKPYLEKAGKDDKMLLIDFWGTWCGPCKAALPQLREIEDQYADKINILSVLFDSADNIELGNQILDEHGLTGDRLLRPNEMLTQYFEVKSYPTYILLDKDGTILTKGSSAQTLIWIEDHYLK